MNFFEPPPAQTVAERFAFHIRREWRAVKPTSDRSVMVQMLKDDIPEELNATLGTAARILKCGFVKAGTSGPDDDGRTWLSVLLPKREEE